MDISAPQNRVIWTRIVRNQIRFKRFLTSNLVWVLWLFLKKNPAFIGSKSPEGEDSQMMESSVEETDLMGMALMS